MWNVLSDIDNGKEQYQVFQKFCPRKNAIVDNDSMVVCVSSVGGIAHGNHECAGR